MSKALIGKNCHIFLDKDPNEAIKYITEKSISPDHLNYLTNKLQQLSNLFCGKYIFCAIPDKAEIYTEYLPYHVNLNHITPIDMLYKELESKQIKYFDIKPIFKKLKTTLLLYQYCDSHWTIHGAYYHYKNLINEIKEICPNIGDPIPFEDLVIENSLYKECDLLNIFNKNQVEKIQINVDSKFNYTIIHFNYEQVKIIIDKEWIKFLDRYAKYINFDPELYLKLNPDIGKVCIDNISALYHFIEFGISEPRNGPHKLTNIVRYLNIDQLINLSTPIPYDLYKLSEIKILWLQSFLNSQYAVELFTPIYHSNTKLFLSSCLHDDFNYKIKNEHFTINIEYNNKNHPTHKIINNNNSNLPNAVIIHDSFFYLYHIELLARHFTKSTFIFAHSMPPIDTILNESPDIVIHEIAGRFLVNDKYFKDIN